ncbi:MAG: type II secretion system protein [Elusimicrobiota bacterium]|jgi:prepilin-type N-terminal cleavage/methylation domain-containing protein
MGPLRPEAVLPSPAAARRRGRPNGFTLIEILISVLLIAAVVTSIFPLLLTSKLQVVKSGRRGEALNYTRQAMETLKAFTTGDSSYPTGPGGALPWTYPGEACGGCWALAPGTHNLTPTLPASFTGAPVNGTISYTVSDFACGSRTCKQVQFSANWSD